MITKVTAEVVRKLPDESPYECSVEYIVNTNDESAAIQYVKDQLILQDWKIISIRASTTWLHEITQSKETGDYV